MTGRTGFWRSIALLFLIGAGVLGGIAPTASAVPPNIVVFLADDVGWKDIGCYGNDVVRTPNIDSLAERGLKFDRAFLTVSQCSPSRISILTGQYPHATGAEDLHMPLPEGSKILPSHLKEAGYFSGHMKKTHYGKFASRQFDWYEKGLDRFGDFLDATKGNPFFLWVGFVDAHRPYAPYAVEPPHDPRQVKVPRYLADTWETRVELALYYDEITRMDGVIGDFVATLEARGLRDDTLVIFLSDNGMPFPRAKGTVYDSGIGTPLVMSWPNEIEAGSTYAGLTSVVDLAPTLLDLAGVDVSGREFQGASIARVMRGENVPGRRYVFSERNWHDCDDHIRSVRTERFKFIRNAYLDIPHGTPADLGGSTSFKSLLALKAQGKLAPEQKSLFQVPRPRVELYDLERDPGEFVNIAATEDGKKVAQELEAVLDRWVRDTGDFPPEFRRRGDHTDRYTGERTQQTIPPMTNPLPE